MAKRDQLFGSVSQPPTYSAVAEFESPPPFCSTVPGFRIAVLEPIPGEIDLSDYIEGLDWVIVGSETGDKARPADKDWFRNLRDVAQAASKHFFIRQLGTSHKNQKRRLDGRTWNEFPEGYVKKVKGVVDRPPRVA